MSDSVYVAFCERVKGKALYASNSYEAGEVIFLLSGRISSTPTKYTIEIGKNMHIIDKYGIFMNHSSTPTTKIVGRKVVANTTITENMELNFNYNESETLCSFTFRDADTGEMVVGHQRA